MKKATRPSEVTATTMKRNAGFSPRMPFSPNSRVERTPKELMSQSQFVTVSSESPLNKTSTPPSATRLGSPGRGVRLPVTKPAPRHTEPSRSLYTNGVKDRSPHSQNGVNNNILDQLGDAYNPLEEVTNQIQILTESLERETENSKVIFQT